MNFRDTYCEINLDNFIHNYQTLENHTGKDIFCVIKANAYGHCDYHIAFVASELGCKYLCVSSLDEAMNLRNNGIDNNILILGYVDPRYLDIVYENNLTITVFSLEYAKHLVNHSKLKVHFKIDTGMNRIGFKKINEVIEALNLLKDTCDIEGIFTHFYNAESEDGSALAQMKYFYAVVDHLDYNFKYIHTSNSNGSIKLYDNRSNANRIGLALYGIKDCDSELDLWPVLSLYSSIIHIKHIEVGESVGYGATYSAIKPEIIATIPIGYGDGFIRKNQDRFVCIEGHPYQIVGRICMDQMMVKVDKEFPIGQKVEIIGEYSPLNKMAKELGMIPYEVLCLLNDRICRKIIRNNKIIDEINLRVSI